MLVRVCRSFGCMLSSARLGLSSSVCVGAELVCWVEARGLAIHTAAKAKAVSDDGRETRPVLLRENVTINVYMRRSP